MSRVTSLVMRRSGKIAGCVTPMPVGRALQINPMTGRTMAHIQALTSIDHSIILILENNLVQGIGTFARKNAIDDFRKRENSVFCGWPVSLCTCASDQ